jgi:hypothetical protein
MEVHSVSFGTHRVYNLFGSLFCLLMLCFNLMMAAFGNVPRLLF